ncbi:MAG: hypothetical protein MUO19_02160, partial [Dehalococcoidales bacterium]|nr:hypothetical protein [Dehalococcoidales bacterium]
MDTEKKWEDMTWEEKREERFKVWLNPQDVKFVSPEAGKAYKERVTRFQKAIKLEEPDRVPVMLPSGTYPAYYAGESFRTIMYDYEAMKKAWTKFMDDFGDMDTYMGPGLVPCGTIAEAMDSKITALPGLGLPENATMNQIIEGEYMMADEYDALMMDPTDYHLRTMLPRTAGLFESFKKLPPLRNAQGAMWVSILADPDIRKTFRTLMDLADENQKHMTALMEISTLITARGYPPLLGFGLMAGAPFDHFADMLRGTHGIIRDMFRQPQKLHEAMEYWLKVQVSGIKNFPMTACPVCVMPLHKGDDTFMSDKQFGEFYWPTLRRLFLAMIDEGLVPMPFAEGKYTRRLKSITDTPRSGVVWWFDQTDM